MNNTNQEKNTLNQEEANLNQEQQEEEANLKQEQEEEAILKQEQEEETFLKKFNKDFEEKQKLRKMKIVDMERKKLKEMQKQKKVKNIHDLTLGEILVNTKDTYINIINELLDPKEGFLKIFTKENRMFYIGVSLLIISFLIYVISFVFDTDDNSNKNEIENSTDKINIYLNSPTKSETIKNNKLSQNKTDKIPNKNIDTITKSIDNTNNTNNTNNTITQKNNTDNTSSDSSKSEELSINSNDLKINSNINTNNLKVVDL